jgi:vitamin B12 transporter
LTIGFILFIIPLMVYMHLWEKSVKMALCAAIALSFPGLTCCQEIELEPITVSLDAPEIGYLKNPVKNNTIIIPGQRTAESIDNMLDTVTGIDISRRGIFDMQSDMSIRGSTFEQTSISVNGIVLNDPQTGHHNLDLAFPQAAIDSLETVRGQSTKYWAQPGIGGSVNINTKRPLDTESSAYFLYGSDKTRKASAYASFNKNKNGLNMAVEESASDGFRPDTDFRHFSLSSSGLVHIGDYISSYIFAGYGEKEFGAANFYAPYNSKEWTDTSFINWQTSFEKGNFKIGPSIYYRKHHDKFMLDIQRPDFYLNHHKTDIRGILIEADLGLGMHGGFQALIDINEQSINSTKLGKDSRNRYSCSFIWNNHNNILFGYDASLRIDDYSEYSTEILPQAGIYIRPFNWVTLRFSAAKSSRCPSYTDLFYEDPANKGNKDLSPERAISYEAGADIRFGENPDINLSITLFRRDADSLIDWVKYSASDTFFQAENITEVKTEGIEVELRADLLSWLKVRTGYAYIDSDIKKKEAYISKYALNHPDHKLSADADIILPFGIQNINFIYKDKKKYSSYFIIGCDLNYDLNKQAGIFLIIDNILDEVYWDIRDNVLPGRQFMAGIKAKF